MVRIKCFLAYERYIFAEVDYEVRIPYTLAYEKCIFFVVAYEASTFVVLV